MNAANILQPSPPALAIKLFGPMEVRVHGELLPRLRSRKSLWLLALLTLRHDRPVERAWLAGILWPEALQKQSFSNLAVVLSDLRKALGDQKSRIQAPTHQTILLDLKNASGIAPGDAPGINVDTVAFDDAIKKGDLLSLQRAVELYGGSFLEGCPEEWVFQERQQREQECLKALQTLAETASLSRDHEAACLLWQRAVRLDPFWDRARCGAMEALSACGDRNSALQVYRDFANLLARDSGASPDKATTAVYQRLRALARTPVATSADAAKPVEDLRGKVAQKNTGYLPHAVTRLIGRDDERVEVSEKLRQTRLVTLTGPGGIGKTRLATEVAAEIDRRYVDGVWFVSLEALSARSATETLCQQVAARFALKVDNGQDFQTTVTNYIRGKDMLLVLDNCEHMLEVCTGVVAHLLRECPQLRVLATSREALGIKGEIAWLVPPLAVPDPAHLPQARTSLARILAGFDSVQLFEERARAVQQNFMLAGSNALLVAEICARLEGIPLAIELAAVRIKAMTLDQIEARLQEHWGQLDLLGRSGAALSRQQTMRATMDWSYELMNDSERLLLRRLSVFAGGCTLAAVEGVCSCDLIPPHLIHNLLELLVDKSVLRFVHPDAIEQDDGIDGRYLLLEVVRQYAAEQLGVGNDAEEARARHRDWFLAFAEAAEPALQTANNEGIVRQLEADYGNLRAILTWCETEPLGGQVGLRLIAALFRFWFARSEYRECRQFLEQALDRAGSSAKPLVRAKALGGLGAIAFALSDYTAAQAAYEKCLELYREQEDRGGIARTLLGLGKLAVARGDYSEAQALLEDSLSLYRHLDIRNGIGHALTNLGNVLYYRGNYDAARVHYQEGLTLFQQINDRPNTAWALSHVGKIAYDRCEYEAARRLFEESLGLFVDLKERRSIAILNMYLGNLACSLGDYSAARTHLELSAEIQRSTGDRRGLAGALLSLAEVHSYDGNSATARSLSEECLGIFREIGDKHSSALALTNLASAEYQDGDPRSACARYVESLTFSQELRNVSLVARNLEGLAGAVLLLPQPGEARAARLWGASEAVREQIGVPIPANEREAYERNVYRTRATLGEDVFAAAWEQGRALTWEQAVALALSEAAASNRTTAL